MYMYMYLVKFLGRNIKSRFYLLNDTANPLSLSHDMQHMLCNLASLAVQCHMDMPYNNDITITTSFSPMKPR